MIQRCRPQFRLSTLVMVVLMSGLSLGLGRAWWSLKFEVPSTAERIVSEVLASRNARKPSTLASTADPSLLGGFVAMVIMGAAFRRTVRPVEA